MEIDFELFGDISGAETIAFTHSIRELRQLRERFGHGRWESVKGLLMCASAMVRYGLPNYIGMKPMVLVK